MRRTCAVHGSHDATGTAVIDGRTYHVCAAIAEPLHVHAEGTMPGTGRNEVAEVLRAMGQGTAADIAAALNGHCKGSPGERRQYLRVANTLGRMLAAQQVEATGRMWQANVYRLTGATWVDGRGRSARRRAA